MQLREESRSAVVTTFIAEVVGRVARIQFFIALFIALTGCGRSHTGDLRADYGQEVRFRLLAQRLLAAATAGDTVAMGAIVIDTSVVTRLIAWRQRDPRSLAAAAADSLRKPQFSKQGPDTVLASFDFRYGSRSERVAIDFVRRGESWSVSFVGLRIRHKDIR
jgi:hypothetical protein